MRGPSSVDGSTRRVRPAGRWRHLPGVDVRPVDHHLAQLLDVPRGDRLRVGELLGEDVGHADLAGADVRVGRDDGAAREVDALAHHVLAEQAVLLLEQLERDAATSRVSEHTGRQGGREGEREGGRERGREGVREGGREGVRE